MVKGPDHQTSYHHCIIVAVVIAVVIITTLFTDVGASNHRQLCAVYYSKTPGFEVKGFLSLIESQKY